MAKKTVKKAPAKAAVQKRKPVVARPMKVGAGELVTLLDYVRYATSRFIEAKLAFAHGTTDPVAEAAFIVCELLHLHPDQFETFAIARVTAAEGRKILAVIDARVATRKPAAYLVNKIYMRGLPFYVDERVIVPRSFIGELLESHFSGEDGSLIDDPLAVESVLELCDAQGMADLPEECRHEPAMAFDGGDDGIDLVRRIVEAAGDHLNPGGGLLCEVGRCQPALEQAYPDAGFLWLDSEDSEGEVFWLPAAS
jgi:methylase of polypeptide subunit release factors